MKSELKQIADVLERMADALERMATCMQAERDRITDERRNARDKQLIEEKAMLLFMKNNLKNINLTNTDD